MEKKITIMTIGILFLFLSSLCYAQIEPPDSSAAEGEHRLGNVVIKFMPPKDWKEKKTFAGGINFVAPASAGFTLLSIDAYPASGFAGLTEDEILKRLMVGPAAPNEQIVTFANTKAVSSIDDSTSMVSKTITCVKGGYMFIFGFTAEKENFDDLLPIVDQSLETFEIVSAPPVPKDISDEEFNESLDLYIGLETPPADGIYKRDDLAVSFKPPQGWKVYEDSFKEERGSLIFMPSSSETTNLSIVVFPLPGSFPIEPEEMLNILKKEENVTSAEIIDIAETKAASIVTNLGGMITNQVQFDKGKNRILITFLTEEEDFEKYMPAFQESLKSFKIIAPSPKAKLSENEDLSLSPSERLFKKFQAISDKLCMTLVVQHNEIAKIHGEELDEKGLQEMADTASSDLMTRYKNAFTISDAEAKTILFGQYNNVQNKKDIENSILEFEKLNVILPLPIEYLVSRYDEHQLSNLELEFAVRLFKEYLEQKR